jgi:hypothetical protein
LTLYDIEDRIRGMTADERRELRRQHARPVFDDLKAWITDTLPTVPGLFNADQISLYARM